MELQLILEQMIKACRPWCTTGKVASYIPELGKADPMGLGAVIADVNGNIYCAGDHEQPFTMQSISKVVTLSLALLELGEEIVFSKVGMEAVADPFNSIMRLEMDKPHRPHNPFINSGAIVLASILPYSDSDTKVDAILDLTRQLTGNPSIHINEEVYLSEKMTGERNRALAYFLSSTQGMEGDVEEILDVYFQHCSMEITARDLAVMGATIAQDGHNPYTGEEVLSQEICRIVRALMVTCGAYDGSGEFAVRIGMPCKSGVGGGIMASLPGMMGIGVFGPSLDHRGNSLGGAKILEMLSAENGLRIL
jgi:glutaminase